MFDASLFNDNGNWKDFLKGDLWSKARVHDVAVFTKDEDDSESGQESVDWNEDDVASLARMAERRITEDVRNWVMKSLSERALSKERLRQDAQTQADPLHETSSNKLALDEDYAAECSLKRTRYD